MRKMRPLPHVMEAKDKIRIPLVNHTALMGSAIKVFAMRLQ
jgi:hypothetical protein